MHWNALLSNLTTAIGAKAVIGFKRSSRQLKFIILIVMNKQKCSSGWHWAAKVITL